MTVRDPAAHQGCRVRHPAGTTTGTVEAEDNLLALANDLARRRYTRPLRLRDPRVRSVRDLVQVEAAGVLRMRGRIPDLGRDPLQVHPAAGRSSRVAVHKLQA